MCPRNAAQPGREKGIRARELGDDVVWCLTDVWGRAGLWDDAFGSAAVASAARGLFAPFQRVREERGALTAGQGPVLGARRWEPGSSGKGSWRY